MINKLYLFILLAIIISIGIAYFQYLYRDNKTKSKLILFGLRSLSVFLLLLLLINPKIKNTKVETIKPNLVLLVDNSKSIGKLNQKTIVKNLVDKLNNDSKLLNKFKIDTYNFSDDISFTDSLSFQKNTTNISKSLKSVQKLYKKTNAPIVLITDGNQTYGTNYSQPLLAKHTIYPIVVGDTTTYQDVSITHLNVNKYAYLKHKFPVELFVNYQGNKNVETTLTITEGKTNIYTKKIELDKKNNTLKVNFFIPANQVGLHTFQAKVTRIKNEKNTLNNRKSFTIEVLNEQSKIVIISDILHPDIAMLKRAIEHNKQRKVIIKPTKNAIKLNDYQLVILYQPNKNFKEIITELNNSNKNSFVITGTKTDWSFLNSVQSNFNKKTLSSTEDFIPIYNSAYSTFLVKDIGFDTFSPLTDYFGKVSFTVPYQSLLFQQVGSIASNNPLFVTFEQNGQRNAVLFGENAWRWRMTSKIESQSFEPFDSFINGVVQYLASNKKSNHLEILKKPYYYQNETVKITAKVYDANYQFNPNVKLWLSLTNKSTHKKIKYPFALTNNQYEVKITDLNSGNYTIKVYDDKNLNTALDHFTVLDYNIEEQFTNANNKALTKLAVNTNGKVYYPNNIDHFIDKMLNDSQYKSIQKSKETKSPLIDWKWILGLITLLLSIEWFIRKYKGFL